MRNEIRRVKSFPLMKVVFVCLVISAVLFPLPAYGSEIVSWGNQKTPNALLTNLTKIAAGRYHSLALKSDGSIVGWGNNDSGQATPPAGNDFIAIATGSSHSLAIKSDGSIVGWGSNERGQATPPDGNNFIAIAASYDCSLALKSDGSIVGWGYNWAGQATPPADNNNFVAIAAGGYFSLALKSDGSIVGWGYNGAGQATPPDGNDFIAIAAGYNHSIAFKSDGSIVGWGYNGNGEATPPAGNNFLAVAAGGYHSLALKSDGSIVCWGYNNYCQATPPAGNNFITVAAGDYHSLALKSDSTIVGWGDNTYSQATPPAGNNFLAVAAGGWHSLALKPDGSIVGWGHNSYGQATPPADNNNFVAIAAGEYFSLALKSDGTIVGWGRNNYGGATPPAGNNFIAVAAGKYHGLALKSDGSIVGWGNNDHGQATPPAGNNFIAITAGGYHSLALKSDGTIIGWGNDESGQTTPPAGNDFIAFTTGETHSLALKSDGTIVGWGKNNYGQTTPPAGNDFIAIAAGWGHSLALKGGQSFLTFKIMRVDPLHTGNTGPVVLRVIGSGIKDGATVRLTRGETELVPMETNFISIWRLDAKFDLNGAMPGRYNVIVTNPGGQSTQLAEGFEVVDGGSPHLWTKLTVPPQVRPGRKYTVSIEFGNDGDAPLPIPIIKLSNTSGAKMQLGEDGRQSETEITIIGIPNDKIASEFLPGERGYVNIEFTASNTPSVDFQIIAFLPDDTPFPWDSVGDAIRPTDMNELEWQTQWQEQIQGMGTTWQSVVENIISLMASISELANRDFLNMVGLGVINNNLGAGNCDFVPERDVNVVGDFDSSKNGTYVITHGFLKSADDPAIAGLGNKINTICSGYNVLYVDWEKGASCLNAATNIAAAAQEAHRQLQAKIGQNYFDWNTVTYIGHSFGNSVNKQIAAQEGRNGRGIILDPANNIGYGQLESYFENAYLGGSVAVITDSLFDNGPCWPFPRRIADGQFHLHSDIGVDGHGKALECFTNQLDNCDNAWLKGTLAQSVPKSGAGSYDGIIGCDGEVQADSAYYTCKDINIFMPWNIVKVASCFVIRPRDPSEKRGTIGYDPNGTPDELCRHFVCPSEPLMYTVFFENEPNATAPAQEVRVVDYLSPSLNWATIELGEIVFGDQVVTTLAGKVSGQVTVPLADSNYVVDVNVQFNVYTGRITWVLRTIDPNTGELPEDPLAGFLPPNDANHCGEGHVSFVIYPQKELLDARITNRATIFFDTETPLDVNAWPNSVDGLPPVSAVSPLPALTTPTRFEVCWSGDDGQGCGIAGYDIYVAANNEPNVPWILNTCETSAVFVGVPGYTYRFYSIARDFMGNIESAPAVPDAEATLGPIDLHFYARFATHWLDLNCELSNIWCDGADLDTSGQVDIVDLSILAENWLEGT